MVKSPPLLDKERGTKGVRFINNLLVRAIGYPTLGGFPYLYAGEGNRGTS